MSSILKISPLNVLHFTTSSMKSPDSVFYICKQCRDVNSALPREKRFYSSYESLSSKTAKEILNLKRSKKYTELVRETKNNIIQKKIRFKKLTACHVKEFAEQPGMILKLLNKPSKKSHLNKDYDKKLTNIQAQLNKNNSVLSKINESFDANKVPDFEKSKILPLNVSDIVEPSESNLNQANDTHFEHKMHTIKMSPSKTFGRQTGTLKSTANIFSTTDNLKEVGSLEVRKEAGNLYVRKTPKYMSYSKLKKLKQDEKNKLMPLNTDYLKENNRKADSHTNMDVDESGSKDENIFGNYNNTEKTNSRQKIFNTGFHQHHLRSPDDSKMQKLKGIEVLDFEEEKKYSYKEYLYSYTDVCIHSNMIESAYDKLISNTKSHYLKKGVRIYNLLLHGYSRLCNWARLEEILKIMDENGISMDSQSYAAIFDCLGSITNENNENFQRNQVEMYLGKLKSQGLHIDDLFHKTKLINDQREIILKVLTKFYPDYKVPKQKIQLNSDCELLQPLEKMCESYKSPAPEEITHEILGKLIEEQLEIEDNFVVRVKSVMKPKSNIEEKTEQLFNEWKPILYQAFIKSVQVINYDNNSIRKKSLTPYLKCLPPEIFVDCMLQELRRVVSDFNEPPIYLSSSMLGNRVWQRYIYSKKKNTGEFDKLICLYKRWTDWYLNNHESIQGVVNGRQYWQMLLQNYPEGPHIDLNIDTWPLSVRRDIGDFLYRIMIKDCKFNVNIMKENKSKPRLVPVFYTKLVLEQQKQTGYLKFHPTMQKIFQAFHCKNIEFDSDQIPMLCPPKPWSHVNSGGFLVRDTLYMRPIKGVKAKTLPYNRLPQEQLYPTLDALNQLQSIPWRVNENVLEVALTVFRLGGSEELEVPSLPDMKKKNIVIPKDLPEKEKIKLKNEHKKIVQERLNQYGLWCEALYKLSLANHFRKRVIWMPQNMDFRGRVYPVPPHFNHLSSDLYRSLLIFAKGKRLGPNGLDWLKIHAINLTGTHKKNPIKERLEYANKILDKILDSAEHPLTGEMWWKKSDEPWQTLAACMEINKALKCPDPENYVSHFPIHQDGSCNGLQHYAALGRDVIGAKSVNVSPSNTPQDVYSCVLAIVEEKRKADARNGNKIAQILEGFVERKVIKQTIMTTVYGVTPYGAKSQILRQLEYLKEFDQSFGRLAAAYLSQKVFESLNEMFTSATEIQEWFVNCANVISNTGGDYVKWVTPLGLPVVQPYAKQCKIEPKDRERAQRIIKPNVMKQRNAFPPNFVHSLDSSHMMLTALHCEQAGITFAAVHDCFWTHPCSVEIMNRICREQFLALHSQPILQKLAEQFRESYQDLPSQKKQIFENIPRTGNLDLNSVLDSVYFFS